MTFIYQSISWIYDVKGVDKVFEGPSVFGPGHIRGRPVEVKWLIISTIIKQTNKYHEDILFILHVQLCYFNKCVILLTLETENGLLEIVR